MGVAPIIGILTIYGGELTGRATVETSKVGTSIS